MLVFFPLNAKPAQKLVIYIYSSLKNSACVCLFFSSFGAKRERVLYMFVFCNDILNGNNKERKVTKQQREIIRD